MKTSDLLAPSVRIGPARSGSLPCANDSAWVVQCGQKKKPSAVAGKFSFCFGSRVEARAKNVRGNFRTSRPTVSGNRRLRATCRREFDGPYFLDLVVDFFEELFLPPELLEPDLLPIFFAMALTSFLG